MRGRVEDVSRGRNVAHHFLRDVLGAGRTECVVVQTLGVLLTSRGVMGVRGRVVGRGFKHRRRLSGERETGALAHYLARGSSLTEDD